MHATHAGYNDPNNLKFEDIVILGVPNPAQNVAVTHVNSATNINTTTILPNSSIQYDQARKVSKPKDIVVQCKVKLTTALSYHYFVWHRKLHIDVFGQFLRCVQAYGCTRHYLYEQSIKRFVIIVVAMN